MMRGERARGAVVKPQHVSSAIGRANETIPGARPPERLLQGYFSHRGRATCRNLQVRDQGLKRGGFRRHVLPDTLNQLLDGADHLGLIPERAGQLVAADGERAELRH